MYAGQRYRYRCTYPDCPCTLEHSRFLDLTSEYNRARDCQCRHPLSGHSAEDRELQPFGATQRLQNPHIEHAARFPTPPTARTMTLNETGLQNSTGNSLERQPFLNEIAAVPVREQSDAAPFAQTVYRRFEPDNESSQASPYSLADARNVPTRDYGANRNVLTGQMDETRTNRVSNNTTVSNRHGNHQGPEWTNDNSRSTANMDLLRLGRSTATSTLSSASAQRRRQDSPLTVPSSEFRQFGRQRYNPVQSSLEGTGHQAYEQQTGGTDGMTQLCTARNNAELGNRMNDAPSSGPVRSATTHNETRFLPYHEEAGFGRTSVRNLLQEIPSASNRFTAMAFPAPIPRQANEIKRQRHCGKRRRVPRPECHRPAVEVIPIIRQTVELEVHLFVKQTGNLKPSDSEGVKGMITRFMRYMGLVQLVTISSDDTAVDINRKFNEEFSALKNRRWIILTNKVGGKTRRGLHFADFGDADLLFDQLESQSHLVSKLGVRRLYIAPHKSETNIPVNRNDARVFANLDGFPIEALRLGFVTGDTSDESAEDEEDIEPQTSGPARQGLLSESDDEEGISGVMRSEHLRSNPHPMCESSDDQHDNIAGPSSGRNSEGQDLIRSAEQSNNARNLQEVITIDDEVPHINAAATDPIRPAVAEPVIIFQVLPVDELPVPVTAQDGNAVRKTIANLVTGGRNADAAYIHFRFQKDGNAERYVIFLAAHSDEDFFVRFVFDIDEGVDCGGLWREGLWILLKEFLKITLPASKVAMFEELENGVFVANFEAAVMQEDKAYFRAFGTVLFQSFVHEGTWPDSFSTSVLRRALGLPIDSNEIYKVNPWVGRMISRIILAGDQLHLQSDSELKAWFENNPNISKEILNSNPLSRTELAVIIADWEVEGKRAYNNRLILEGFMKGNMLYCLMNNLKHWKSIEQCLHAVVTTGPELIAQFAPLSPFATDTQRAVFDWLLEIINDDLSPLQRQKFLRFITASKSIPSSPPIAITWIQNHPQSFVPNASTCNHRISLGADYESKERLLTAVLEAVETIDNPLANSFDFC